MARRKQFFTPGRIMTIGGAIGLGLVGGLVWALTRPGIAHAPTHSDTIPDNPREDVFGNTGADNMVEPLTLREDRDLMRDQLNEHEGLL